MSSLLLIIFFLIRKNRNQRKKLWVIFFYVVSSFLFDFIRIVYYDPVKYAVLRRLLNAYFSIAEYTFISIYLYLVLRNSKFKKMLLVCTPVFMTVAIINMTSAKTGNFDAVAAPTEAILIILFGICFFYEQITDPEVTFIYASKDFWIITGCMLYFSATLFLFISTAYLTEVEREKIWFINDVANIAKNIFFAIAFNKSLIKSKNNELKLSKSNQK